MVWNVSSPMKVSFSFADVFQTYNILLCIAVNASFHCFQLTECSFSCWTTSQQVQDSTVVVAVKITLGLSPSLSFPGWPEPRAVCFRFLLQPLLQTRLCALRHTDNSKKKLTGIIENKRRKIQAVTELWEVRLSNEEFYQVRLCALLLSLFFTRLFRLLLISHLHRKKKRFNSSHAQKHHSDTSR